MAVEVNSDSEVSLQLANLHGDIVATATLGQAGIDSYTETDEYGQPKAGTSGSRYGWLGVHQRDTDTDTDTVAGMVLMGARLYNPTTGRFLSIDPIEGGNDNRYGYPPDPVNKLDISGESWLSALGALAEVVSFIPGPIGMIATAVAVTSYAVGGCLTCAAGAAIGFIPGAKLVSGLLKVGLKGATKTARFASLLAKANKSKALKKLASGAREIVSVQARSKHLGIGSKYIGKNGKWNKGKVRLGWSRGAGGKMTFRLGYGTHKNVFTHHSNIAV